MLFQNILTGRSLLANTSISWIGINLSKDKTYLKKQKVLSVILSCVHIVLTNLVFYRIFVVIEKFIRS